MAREAPAPRVSSMPAGAPGSLSEDQYTNITAYLLWANGAKPGRRLSARPPM